MAKDHPHGRSADGRSYTCGLCGDQIPDGALVAGEWSSAGKLRGVKVTTTDDEVLHECGTKLRGDGRG